MNIPLSSPADIDPAAYRRDGYVALPGLLPREVATGLIARMKADFHNQGIPLSRLEKEGPLLRRAAPELYGYHYPLFASFHWGLTPIITALVGEPLLPSYCYFRLYREGDICRVHGDRPACEHSVSLTLGYADDLPWPLEVARQPIETPYNRADAEFRADEAVGAVAMQVGDGVLYQGVHHHHGRTTPNPNRWSAHLFLHWVARNGPHADSAFDGQNPPSAVEF